MQYCGHRGPEAGAGMAEDRSRSSVWCSKMPTRTRGPIMVMTPSSSSTSRWGDRPARDVGEDLSQLVKRPMATSEVVASAKLIWPVSTTAAASARSARRAAFIPLPALLLVSSPASIDRRRPGLMNHSE